MFTRNNAQHCYGGRAFRVYHWRRAPGLRYDAEHRNEFKRVNKSPSLCHSALMAFDHITRQQVPLAVPLGQPKGFDSKGRQGDRKGLC